MANSKKNIDPNKKVNLHAEMSYAEREELKKWKGPRKHWREWLLSIPQLLRERQDKLENLELRIELLERDKHELEERCRRLQEKLND